MSFLWRMLPYILLAAVIGSSRFYFYVFHFQVGRTIFFLNIFVGVIAIFIYLAALRDVYRDFVANLLIMKLPSINNDTYTWPWQRIADYALAITSLALGGITELYLIGKGLRLVTTPRDEIDLLKHSGINRLTIGLTLIIDVYMRVVLLVVFYLVAIKASQEIFRLKLTIVSILLSMFVRQLAFILSAKSIPEILRRASGPPHWSFLVIGIGELVAFVLAANAIINWESDATIRVDGLIAILKGLIFGYVPDLLGYLFIFQFPPSYMVLISLIAIVLSYNIINSLLNFKLFKRHDVDYLIIARSNLAEGNYVNALAVLEQVKHHTISWYCIRSVCFLGLFQFGDAWSTLLHAR